jgi:hypothetical protein
VTLDKVKGGVDVTWDMRDMWHGCIIRHRKRGVDVTWNKENIILLRHGTFNGFEMLERKYSCTDWYSTYLYNLTCPL